MHAIHIWPTNSKSWNNFLFFVSKSFESYQSGIHVAIVLRELNRISTRSYYWMIGCIWKRIAMKFIKKLILLTTQTYNWEVWTYLREYTLFPKFQYIYSFKMNKEPSGLLNLLLASREISLSGELPSAGRCSLYLEQIITVRCDGNLWANRISLSLLINMLSFDLTIICYAL